MEQKIEEGSLAHQISFELFVQNDSAQRSIFKARSGSRFQFSVFTARNGSEQWTNLF